MLIASKVRQRCMDMRRADPEGLIGRRRLEVMDAEIVGEQLGDSKCVLPTNANDLRIGSVP